VHSSAPENVRHLQTSATKRRHDDPIAEILPRAGNSKFKIEN
jgi:hypothetical protein